MLLCYERIGIQEKAVVNINMADREVTVINEGKQIILQPLDFNITIEQVNQQKSSEVPVKHKVKKRSIFANWINDD